MHITQKSSLCLVLSQLALAWIHRNICTASAHALYFSLHCCTHLPTLIFFSLQYGHICMNTHIKHTHTSTGSFNKCSHPGTLTLQTWYQGSSGIPCQQNTLWRRGGGVQFIQQTLWHTHISTEQQEVITARVGQTQRHYYSVPMWALAPASAMYISWIKMKNSMRYNKQCACLSTLLSDSPPPLGDAGVFTASW